MSARERGPGAGSAVRRFVFLDRDGTLVRDEGYVHRVEDYALLPGVVPGLARLRDAGFALCIVTNQSGIGRGYYTEAQFQAFQARLLADLEAAGIRIERSYFCPHLPDAGCACRKPEPGLLRRAHQELGADLAASWVIGDRALDVELARRAGVRGAVLIANASPAPVAGSLRQLQATDLTEAAQRLIAAERADR